MKRIALLLAALASLVAGPVGQPVAAAKEPAVVHAKAALAVVGVEGRTLAWVDPRTLKRLKRGSVTLGSVLSPLLSPSGKRVAVGGRSLGIRVVDLKRMKLTAGSIAKRLGWTAEPIAWPSARRLFALEWNDASNRHTLVLVDPTTRTVLRRLAIDGYTTWVRTPTGVVALGRLSDDIGPAQLLIVDLDGSTKSIKLERIEAGGRMEGTGEEPIYRMASPALAIDPAGRYVYVVGQESLAAEVDLATLDVFYRNLRRPAATTKVVSGWHRQAVALGDGRFAVAGSDYDRLRREPSGVELLDMRSGTMRRIDGRGSTVLATNGMLVVVGEWSEGDGAWTGMGVAAYTLDGDKLWHSLQGAPVSWVQTAGGYAYVVGEEAYPQTLRVIDLANGSVRVLRGQMPLFVS